MNKKEATTLVLIVAAVGYMTWTWLHPLMPRDELVITVLDIGQGDAIYIRTPGGVDILIDGGPDRKVISELGEVMPPFDRNIELVIATHPDADHIAGLTEIPYSYTIGTLITSGSTKSTGFSREMESWTEEYGIETLHAYRGWQLPIEEGLWFEFLHPDPPIFHDDPNDDSVVFILHYGEFRALFMGDASIENEHDFLEKYQPVSGWDVDILKAGHHGSRTSSSAELLDAVTPETVLIPVGKDNKFLHPHSGPLLRMYKRRMTIWRTDTQGRIVCAVSVEIACTSAR